jgi:hypothetical protein
MNKQRYNQIIDDAYKNFKNNFPMKKSNPPKDYINSKGQLLTKEEFIDKCKTDNEFSKKWGLKIEERELSLEERVDYFNSKMMKEGIRTQIGTVGVDESYWRKALEETNHDIPTRGITVTYKKTIEIYE